MGIRSALAVFSFVLGNFAAYLAISILAIHPESQRLLLPITIAHFLGVIVSALLLPGLLERWSRHRRGEGRLSLFGTAAPLGVILFSALALSAAGVNRRHDGDGLDIAFHFCVGMLLPVLYNLFFTQVPARRQGLFIGLTSAVGLVALHLMLVPEHDGLSPEEIAGWIGYLAAVQFLVLSIMVAAIAIVLVMAGDSLFPPPPPCAEKERKRRSSVWRLTGAVVVSGFVYSVLDARLALTITETYGIDFTAATAILVIGCPLVGACLDRWQAKAFDLMLKAYFVFLLLAPSLALLDHYPLVSGLIRCSASFSQFAIFIAIPVAFSRFAVRDRWFPLLYCTVYIMRNVCMLGVWVVRAVFPLDSGIFMIATTLSAIAFHFLSKEIACPNSPAADREPPPAEEAAPAADEEADAAAPAAGAATPVMAELYEHYGLSRRERDVATLIVEGKGNREIAAALDISEHTVKIHVRNILGKFRVPSRQALLAKVIAGDIGDRREL